MQLWQGAHVKMDVFVSSSYFVTMGLPYSFMRVCPCLLTGEMCMFIKQRSCH